MNDSTFKSFQKFIYEHSGIVLSDQKRSLLQGRIAKRIRALELKDEADYYSYVSGSGYEGELIELLNAVTTNVTHFFRESAHFDFLAKLLPELLKKQSSLKIWSAACSSGEEVYTLLASSLSVLGPQANIQILGTDLSSRVLTKAKKGVYSLEDASRIPPALLHRWFLKGTGPAQGYILAKKELRSKTRFESLNLVHHPYAIKEQFDIIFCRNVMIYFDQDTRAQVVNELAKHLNAGGYLFTAHAESLAGFKHPFKTIAPAIYQKS